jgi:hypothetical protein
MFLYDFHWASDFVKKHFFFYFFIFFTLHDMLQWNKEMVDWLDRSLRIWQVVNSRPTLDQLYVVLHPAQEAKWGGPSNETGKTEAPCHGKYGTINIPPCSKTPSAEHRLKFCSPSPVMVTSPYKAERKTANNQSSDFLMYVETSPSHGTVVYRTRGPWAT